MGHVTAGFEQVENVPDEMSPLHPWSHLVGQSEEHHYPRENRRAASGRTTTTKKLQWFGHIWRMPAHRPQRHVLSCRSIGRKRPPGETPLRWCDLLNDDLKGMRNWLKSIEDRAEWRTTIHTNQPTGVPLGQQHPDPVQRPKWTWRMKEGRCVYV